MRFGQKFVAVFCVLSLSACSTMQVPNGKLHPEHEQYVSMPAEVKAVELVVEQPLTVKVPVTNVQVNGLRLVGALAGLAVSATSTAVSHAKRADEKKAILESIEDTSMYELPGKSYAKTIKQAKWINLKDVVKATNVNKSNKAALVKVGEDIRKEMEGKGFAVYGSDFVIGEQFENLTQNFRFEISSVKEGKSEKNIYKVLISDVYYPEESTDVGFENHALWIQNDNALIKKAIKETTKNINSQLKNYLADPYYTPEEK